MSLDLPGTRTALAVALAGVIGLTALMALSACRDSGRRSGTRPAAARADLPSPTEDAGSEASADTSLLEITLYFADAGGRLKPEKREISPEGTAEERARLVVEALIAGPQSGLTAVMPRDAGLRALYLGSDGTAYVDLDTGFARGVSGGSQDALIAVRSVTDSLAANFPEVRRVKILVEGEEVRDLAGHLDLSRPLAPDTSLAGQTPSEQDE